MNSFIEQEYGENQGNFNKIPAKIIEPEIGAEEL